MRFLSCVFLLTGLSSLAPRSFAAEASREDAKVSNCDCRQVSIWGFSFTDDDADDNDVKPKRMRLKREEPSRSIAEGLSRGTLQPFVELSGKVSNPGDESLHLSGFRVGLSEGGENELALAYYRSPDLVKFRSGTDYSLRYGGLVFGHMPDVDRITEGYFRLLVGTGQVEVKTLDTSRTSRLLFVLEPEIGFGINISSWMQIAAGVSYRYLNGLQVLGLSSEDLRGGTANLHLLFHF